MSATAEPVPASATEIAQAIRAQHARPWIPNLLTLIFALSMAELMIGMLFPPQVVRLPVHLWLMVSELAMWGLLLLLALRTSLWWPLDGPGRVRGILLHLSIGYGASAFVCTLRPWLLSLFMPAELFHYLGGSFEVFWLRTFPWTLMLEVLIYLGFVVIAQWRDGESRRLRAEAEAARARMLAIQNSLSPHFTLNAMNALVAMLPESSREQHFAIQIGGFLRDMLDARNTTTQSLGQEMAMIERYLDIERTRLGDRLDASTAMDVFLRDVEVPVLVLQPLVENAIRHAVAPYREGGSLRVEALRDAGATVLRIESIASEPLRSSPGTGYGEDSSRSRFGLLYGKRVVFSSGRIGERAYRVEIRIRG